MSSTPRINYEQILQARDLLARYFQSTRLQPASSLSRDGFQVNLKIETALPTGTFKVRGAVCALAHQLKQKNISHVVTASTGNHGAAVAYAASLLKVRCTVFLPTSPNPAKKKRIEEFGVNIVESGKDLTEAALYGREYAATEHAYFLDDATDSHVPLGTSTIACEIFEQQPATDVIVVPVGDTALIRGIASAAHFISPSTKIIGVQSANVPGYHAAWHAGHIVPTNPFPTIADGLASQVAIATNVEEIINLVDDFHLVTEEEMLSAMRYLLHKEQVLAEPASAAPVAVIKAGKIDAIGHVICALITGANIAPGLLTSLGPQS
jgi:threonine dehydratase